MTEQVHLFSYKKRFMTTKLFDSDMKMDACITMTTEIYVRVAFSKLIAPSIKSDNMYLFLTN